MLTLFAWHKVCLVVVVGHNFALMLCCDPGTNCLDIFPSLVGGFAMPDVPPYLGSMLTLVCLALSSPVMVGEALSKKNKL